MAGTNPAPRVVISATAFQREGSYGSPFRSASGLTAGERAFLREGGIVLFKGEQWSRRGMWGTKFREVYFRKSGKYNRYPLRVPSPETLALIGEKMTYAPRDRRKTNERGEDK
jgi:hypothetical protein